jgi:hypothetical protein
MPKRTLPKYRHHRASGQAVVTLNGKDVYLGKHGSPESHRRYAELIEKWQRTADSPPTDITVGQLTVLYLQWARGHYVKDGKPTSRLHIVRAALRSLNQVCRLLPAGDLTPKRFVAVRDALLESGTLSRTTINDYMGTIRRRSVTRSCSMSCGTICGAATMASVLLPHCPSWVGLSRHRRASRLALSGERPRKRCQPLPVAPIALSITFENRDCYCRPSTAPSG